MKTEIDKTLLAQVDAFKGYFADGVKYILKAGEQYAQSLEQFPADADIVYHNALPHLQRKDWQLLAKIGRHELTPRALMMPNEYCIKAVEAFPMNIQRTLVGDDDLPPTPQKVLSRGRVIEKTLAQMSKVEVDTVFDLRAGRVRSAAEQMAAADARAKTSEPQQMWAIVQGKLCVYGRTNFTVAEVADILRKMKGCK